MNQKQPATKLILASSSIYRRQLLERLQISFEVASPNIDESAFPQEKAKALSLRLAQTKALAIAKLNADAWVIGSDQVAECAGQVIGKPGTHEKALAQLKQMRGANVDFYTALCLMRGEVCMLTEVSTQVTFRNLPDAVLEAYLQIEKPYDCAGSAKSEGLGIILLEKIHSDDPTALIGLPLIALSQFLRAAGFQIPFHPN
ncbi:MAG: septum formation protein Maf [Polynucleobacter sp.]|jgi:septum formation protein|nr:septum formation protein Maf [Polynucleobacter sp.]